jgi:GTPase SAR1 family protein
MKVVKVCFLGDSNCGKTSLIREWLPHLTAKTDSFTVFTKIVNDEYRLQIFDVNGKVFEILSERYSY